MKRICLFVLLVLGASCSISPKVYLNGEEDALGASVFIDGNKVGEMKKGHIGTEAIIEIPNGNHRLTIVRNDGKNFDREFTLRGEEYIAVDFESKDSLRTK